MSLQKMGIVVFVAAFVMGSFISPVLAYSNGHSTSLSKASSQYWSITDGSQTGLNITGDMTVSVWYKPTTLTNNTLYGLLNKDDFSSQRGYFYDITVAPGGSMALEFGRGSSCGSGTFSASQGISLSSGTWYNLTAVYDSAAGSVQFFVNGVSQGTQTGFGSSIPSCTAEFDVGAAGSGGGSPADGLVNDVRVWSRALSSGEVAGLGDPGTVCSFSNGASLQGWWLFDNNGIDSSGNNNSLTNNNSATFSTDVPYICSVLAVRKPSNQSVSSSSILQDDNELKLTFEANKTYIVDGMVFASATTTSSTPDIILSFTGPASSTITLSANRQMLNGGETSKRIVLPESIARAIYIQGTVVVGAIAGDFQFQWAQSTANAAPTSVLIGSYLRAEEIQ